MFILVITSLLIPSIVFAEEQKENKDFFSQFDKPRFGFGVFKSRYAAHNPNNGEKFDFPYYGLNLSLLASKDIQVSGRIFSSYYTTRYSAANGIPYHHYFYGVGVQGKYSFWQIFYVGLTIDAIYYHIKNQQKTDNLLYTGSVVNSGSGIVASPGAGINWWFGDNIYCYAGQYSTIGRIGIERLVHVKTGENSSEAVLIPDEVIDFTHPDNYEFGIKYFF